MIMFSWLFWHQLIGSHFQLNFQLAGNQMSVEPWERTTGNAQKSGDCAEMSPPPSILLGEELLQLPKSPLCPAHLTATLPAVKQLKLLSWVAAPWDSPSHTPTPVPHLAQQEDTLAQVVQTSCGTLEVSKARLGRASSNLDWWKISLSLAGGLDLMNL